MRAKNFIATAAGLGLSVLLLAGCVTVDDGPVGKPQASAPAASPPANTAPAPETPAPSASDGGQEAASDGGSTSPTPSVPEVSLALEPGEVQYVRAHQAFSPLLERWVIDEQAGEVTYQRFDCVGRTDAAGSGVIVPEKGGTWEITWDGENPTLYAAGQGMRVEISERSLVSGTDVASGNAQIELQHYVGMCRDVGETVAGFVL